VTRANTQMRRPSRQGQSRDAPPRPPARILRTECLLIRAARPALARHPLDARGATRVFLATDERNERSRRLAERTGFEHEGTLRQDRLDLQGRLRDTRVYAIVRPA